MQRTPPGSIVTHVSSENDITNLDTEQRLKYLGRGSKRPRSDDHGNCEDKSLKEELLAMLTKWKKDQDLILKKLLFDIAELKQQNVSIQTTSAEMQSSMIFISKQYEDMKEKLLNMEREKKENLSYIASLECKIDDMQKRLKSTVIEFRNLPTEEHQIKQETQQDLCDVVQKTCNAINVNIESSEIKDIYRIKNKSGPSTVVTELTSVLCKNKILLGVKEFNKTKPKNKLSSTSIGLAGPKMPIYVTEGLTNKDRKLFGMARDVAKNLEYKFCWIINGRIYMRKAEGSSRLEIKKEEDLSALKIV